MYFISYFSDLLEEQDQSEKLETGDPATESDEKPLGEEIKLQKELDENEKDKDQNQDENQNNQNQDKVVEETALETEIKSDKVIEDKKAQEEKKVHEEKKAEEENKKPGSAPALANRFEALQSKNKTQTPTKIIGGSEEDEADEFLIEEEGGDFDWDYDEEDTKRTKTEAEDQGNISDYIEVDEPKEESIPKVSLNPLPPERLMSRTSEEREKSSEPGQDEVLIRTEK